MDSDLEPYREKLESLTQKTKNGCWFYTGPRDSRSGRGRFKVGKRDKNPQIIMWELLSGEKVPEGFWISTNCANNICLHPDHLEIERISFRGHNRKGRPR